MVHSITAHGMLITSLHAETTTPIGSKLKSSAVDAMKESERKSSHKVAARQMIMEPNQAVKHHAHLIGGLILLIQSIVMTHNQYPNHLPNALIMKCSRLVTVIATISLPKLRLQHASSRTAKSFALPLIPPTIATAPVLTPLTLSVFTILIKTIALSPRNGAPPGRQLSMETLNCQTNQMILQHLQQAVASITTLTLPVKNSLTKMAHHGAAHGMLTT